MKLLILSMLVVVATASPLLGSDHCTWGPSYWCSHIKAAKECNAVQHCITTVWKNQKLPAVKDTKGSKLCKFCLDTMTEVQTKAKKTEQEIQQFLEQACAIIPDADMSKECKQVIDKYLPELLQMIIAQLDPKTICTYIGFCTALSKPAEQKTTELKPLDNILGHVQLIKTQPKSSPNLPSSTVECELCKSVITIAKQELESNTTEEEVEQFIEKYLCGHLGKVEKECDDLIKEFAPAIFQMIAQQLDPETICRSLGICTSVKKSPLLQMMKQNGPVKTMIQTPIKTYKSAGCTICEFVMREIDETLKDNATEAEMRVALNKVCSFLPSEVSAECQDLVKLYGDAIIELLVQQVKPLRLCATLGLCPTTKRVPKYSTNGEECLLCQTIMMYLQALLKEATTHTVIKQELERVCNFLPDTEASICDGLVLSFMDKIIDAVINKINPKDICQYVGICPKDKSLQGQSPVKKVKAKEVGVEPCFVCELAINYLDKMLKDNSTEAEIEAGLKSVCGYLPTSVQAECNSIVNQYAEPLIKILAQELDGATVCKLIGVCKAKTVSSPVKAAVECELCTLAMGYLDSMLTKKSTKDEIKAALNKLCTLLPTSAQSECDTFVDLYEPMIIEFLVKGMDPKTVCKELGLCAKGRVKSAVKDDKNCELCKLAITYLDAQLAKNATKQEIKEALDNLCSYLPKSVQSECDALVKQYSSVIIDMIVNGLNATVVCKQLGLCTSARVTSTVNNAVTCEICTLAMDYLDAMLEKNSTQEEIKSALDKLCGYLPSSARSECTDLVEQYREMILNLLAKGLDAKLVCKKLGLCSAVKSAVKNDESCELCKLAIRFLDAQLAKNATKEEIEVALNKLCSYLPKSVQTECDTLVTQYAPMILNLLLEGLDATTVCKELDLCTSLKVPMKNILPSKPRLIGANKCTFGPAYWCANFDNAKKCNAVDHCNKHVWTNEV